MIKEVFNEDIALSTADVIVNASNGFGYMGGNAGLREKKKGVAESIHFHSTGLVEALALGACQAKGRLGYSPGSVFVTAAPGMNCKYIIHAVTMWLPGSRARLKTIRKLAPKIVMKAKAMGAKTVAVPLLGTGTGRLDETEVYNIFYQAFERSSIEFWVYMAHDIHI